MDLRQKVINANIEVHTRMIEDYESEPHWRPENITKVKNRIEGILPKQRQKALDVGAGTGFLTRMLTPLFDEVYAVDVTQAMLEKIPSADNLKIVISPAETLPFQENTFDFVCSYSFLHHLYEPQIVLEEMVRVLKPGGLLYVDLEPNKSYWELMKRLDSSRSFENSSVLLREIRSTVYIEEQIEAIYELPKEVFANAEYSKSISGGFLIDDLENQLVSLGLKTVQVRPDWFLGQGVVMHEKSFELSNSIDEYLRFIFPASKELFKYIWLTAEKG